MNALLALLLLCGCASAFKILIYSPRFGASHVSTLGGVADILVEEGMDVTVVLPVMNPRIQSNGTRLAKTVTIAPDARVADYFQGDNFIAMVWTSEDSLLAAKALMDKCTEVHAQQCEQNLQQKDLLETLKKEKFDLGISEVFDQCGLGMFDAIGLRNHVIFQTALLPEGVAQVFGVPNTPSVLPAYFSDTPMTMSYTERIKNMVKLLFGTYWTATVKDATEAAIQKVLKKKVDLRERLQEAAFVFTNTDPLLDFPRPITERVINVGGLSMPEPKPLDAFWEKVVSSRPTTIFMSFGSVAQSYTMPLEMKKAVLATFRRFPEVTFVWKYEEEDAALAKEAPNVVLHRWVPQNDLLAHPNLRLFVTHCGMNSVLESSQRGVPMICIPLFADQMRNAQMLKRLGTAQQLHKSSLLDSDRFERSIREGLDRESYRQNASRLSRMMAARPRNQRDELVKHVRFAAEFGSLPEYRIPQVSFLQYYMLDILVPCLVSLLLLLVSAARLVHLLWTLIFAAQKEKQL